MSITKSRKAKIQKRSHAINSYRAKADQKRTPSARFADWMTNHFGTTGFLVLNAVWFIIWIIWNAEIIPGIAAFDPFPYGFLTMVVSLEAIFLAIIVLISQNRAARIAELREELDLQINIIAEEEVTKVIKMLAIVLEKNGIDISKDEEIKKMVTPIDSEEIERTIEEEIPV